MVKTIFEYLINLNKKLLIKQSIFILSWSIYLIRELNKNEDNILEEVQLLF